MEQTNEKERFKLNEVYEGEAFKEFYGKNVEQMPKLIAEGRTPMSVAQLMQRRLDVRGASEDVKSAWMDNYFETGDAVVYHPDGRVKIVLDSQHLRDMTLESKIERGVLVLTRDAYDDLEGEEFEGRNFGKVCERLSREEAKAHPVWRVLAREQALLNEYADLIFAEGKERFGYDTAMGVFLGQLYSAINPELEVWNIGKLKGRSYAGSIADTDCKKGCFVGLAPEAQNLLGKPVGQVRACTAAELQAFGNKAVSRRKTSRKKKALSRKR